MSMGILSGPCTCIEVFERWFEIPTDHSNYSLMSSGQPLFTRHSETEGVDTGGLTILLDGWIS